MHGAAGLFIRLPDPLYVLDNIDGPQPVLLDGRGIADESDQGSFGSLGKMEFKSAMDQGFLQPFYLILVGVLF